jgi:hypothetical protein
LKLRDKIMNRENLLWVISTDGNIVTKTKTANLRHTLIF